MTLNKDAFWALMAKAKERCGQDIPAETEYLRQRLRELGPGEALRFHHITHEYLNLAYKYGLWSAAAVLTGGCSDDGFMDFRAWLIGQGKETYLAALRDPDTLASVEPYNMCGFESLCYLGDMVFEELTGRSAYDVSVPDDLREELDSLKNEIKYGPFAEFPMEWDELETYLPRLCAKHLRVIDDRKAHGDRMWNPKDRGIRALREEFGQKRGKINHKKGDITR